MLLNWDKHCSTRIIDRRSLVLTAKYPRVLKRHPVSASLFCSLLDTALSGLPGIQQEPREHREHRFKEKMYKSYPRKQNPAILPACCSEKIL